MELSANGGNICVGGVDERLGAAKDVGLDVKVRRMRVGNGERRDAGEFSDWITASCPFHSQSKLNRVWALGSTGDSSLASLQFFPPSVETSTFFTEPAPDQARPVIWTYPLRISIPAEGRVITDLAAHWKWYQRALPPRSGLETE